MAGGKFRADWEYAHNLREAGELRHEREASDTRRSGPASGKLLKVLRFLAPDGRPYLPRLICDSLTLEADG
jgi:hypothetical protein